MLDRLLLDRSITKIKPYLETLLGPNYRLDHDYLKIDSEQSGKGLYLHGGGQGGWSNGLVGPTDGGQCYYRYSNGRFSRTRCGSFELDGSRGLRRLGCTRKSQSQLRTTKEWKYSKTQDEVLLCVDRVAASAETLSFSLRLARMELLHGKSRRA